MIAFAVFVVCFALILYRKIKILYISLGAAAILILLGIVTPFQVVFDAINWDVLGIYFGFGMLAIAFGERQRLNVNPIRKRSLFSQFYPSFLDPFFSTIR